MPDPINWSLALPLFLGYLIGSIPFGLIFTRLAGLGDVREIGSGNIGATNVLRTGKKSLAMATLAADMLKGTFAYMIAEFFFGMETNMGLLAGLGAFLGHCFPVWLRFRGGKGVAVYFGILAPVSLKIALIAASVWLAVAAISRYSSLASLMVAIVTPVSLYLFGFPQAAEIFLTISLIMVIKHHSNIRRLINRQENRIGGSNSR
ncbi:MAG: glycerol-3-phosphate 1-O-acyltransferase PlsY [Hyphomicrobiales bacterium]|nr:glycerol-3-phosphate 1-O-acyltransferase PlsY [Hyphomicrobiales bacterium]